MGMNSELLDTITKIVYLVASVMFILGLKKLSSPKTAQKGNFYALIGMLMAIAIPCLTREFSTLLISLPVLLLVV